MNTIGLKYARDFQVRLSFFKCQVWYHNGEGARTGTLEDTRGGTVMNKIEKAIILATEAHAGAVRKGKTRPYILHPLEAMMIVAGLTDDEDLIAAAVLHDTVEDTGTSSAEIEKGFGSRVAALVASESEDKREDRPAGETWKTRKKETLDHLEEASREVKLVCFGDKLANMRELCKDFLALGDDLWQRFNQKDKSMHCWYYSELYKILREEFGDVPAIREYADLLEKVFNWKEEA